MKKIREQISVILLRLQINRIIRPGALVRVLICLAVISATAIGCGWFGTSETVRFNHFLKGHDFFRLPLLPRAINSVTGKPVHWYDLEVDSESDTESVNSRHPGKDTEQAWHLAESAEERGELSELRQHLRDYLKFSDLTGDEFGNRNSAFDRLDALQSLDQGTSVKAVSAYLAARAAYDYENYRKAKAIPDPSASGAESSYQLITTVPAEANLKDNIAYLQAALLYRDGNFEEAVKAFTHLAASYPRSEKREAALLMAAISTMKQSRSFTGGSGDPSHNHSYNHYGSPESDPEEVPETCCDAAWQAAKQAFLRQLREYPRGRYESDARGWLAYLHLRAGDRASALIEYYRMLANERDPGSRLNAVFSLTFTRHHATTAQMDRVEAVLADEPAAALAYAYHNLYNYAIDPGEDRSFWGGDKEVKKRQVVVKSERRRIVTFATRLMRLYPQTVYSRAFTLRVAQANLELGEYKSARDFAVRALSLGSTGEERRQALWVKGAAERYLHDYAAARHSLTTLIAEDNGGRLTEGAGRMLAIVAEDSGDLNVALEQYLALNYKYDVAYFIDVLMTPEQLTGFIERHPQLDQHDELRYALGVRYLREHRWNEVRATMARVRTTPGQPVSDYNHYKPSSSPTNPKLPWKTDTKSPGVRETWVLRDLQTVDEFEARERTVELAQGDEAKAETMYQMASWLYQDSTLLFYNPKAWQGWRHDLIERLDTTSLAPNEARLLWEYSQKHEPATHALAIYLQIVQRYPKTRAARDALFTAVVCHERLADYNSYWRSRYEVGLHAGERMVKIREVKKAYPDFRLPRTRLDWEPATRTINGGPAWDPLPKPKPRPSFSTRVKAKLGSLWDSFWDSFWQAVTGFWQNTVRPWLVNGFYTTCEIVICHLVLVVAVMRRRQLKRLWHRFRQMVVGVLRQQQQARSSAGLLSLNLSMNQAGSVQEESVVERIINQD